MASANDSGVATQDLNINPDNNTIEIENITTPQKNTTGIVMQSTDYSCGPAALATVLQNMGINETEQGLAVLAGTNENGTTLYGLVQAAQAKGLNAAGIKLAVDELKANHIVHVILDGTPHYSVVRKVTENSVYLADPSLGNIVMTREKFSEIYTGDALVISDPQEVNQTENTTSTVQPENLTDKEMESIRGKVIFLKVAAVIVVALKVAVKKAVKALSLRQLRTMSFRELRGHIEGWLRKYWLPIALAAHAAREAWNYRVTTPPSQTDHTGVCLGSVSGCVVEAYIKFPLDVILEGLKVRCGIFCLRRK